MNMKAIDFKFNLNDSLEKMDGILNSDDVIIKNQIYTSENAKDARGAIVDASVVSALFTPSSATKEAPGKWAVAHDILMSQIYALVASQSKLLNLEWDGYRLNAIFNTTYKEHIDALLDSVGMLISLTDVINYKIKDTGWSFKIDVVMDYGKVLSVPVEGGNTLWKIDGIMVLDELLKDLNMKRLVITKIIYNNLKENYQTLFEAIEPFDSKYYHADIVNIGINNWLKKQRGEDV